VTAVVRKEVTDTQAQWGVSSDDKLKQLVVNFDELNTFQEQCRDTDQGFVLCKPYIDEVE
jgi:hypothetical protein